MATYILARKVKITSLQGNMWGETLTNTSTMMGPFAMVKMKLFLQKLNALLIFI